MSEATVSQALRAATDRLAATSDTARLDAELLMAHALGVSRSDMLIRHQNDEVPEGFEALIARREQHEPVAHITGFQEFYGRPFAVTQDTLIPRGDSEVLIETALELAPKAERVLDLGTGSGALLITALLELKGASGFGIDASGRTLDVAERNAQTHGLIGARARFALRDWTRPGWAHDLGRFDLVLCNPPYVEAGAKLDADVRDFEPARALFAGEDGLDDYRVLFPQLAGLLNQKGVAIFEIGHRQAQMVSKVAQIHGFTTEIREDLAKRPRAVVCRP